MDEKSSSVLLRIDSTSISFDLGGRPMPRIGERIETHGIGGVIQRITWVDNVDSWEAFLFLELDEVPH